MSEKGHDSSDLRNQGETLLLSHLIYVSAATEPMDSDQLDRLLDECRRYNKEYRLTGMLLYKKQRFMQVIEGEDDEVGRLFELIKQDSRHSAIDILRYEHIQHRSFPDWSMAFSNVDAVDLGDYDSFGEFADLQLDATYFLKTNLEAHSMLLAFKNELWERI